VRAKSSPVVSTLWSLGSGRSFEGTSLEANPLKKEFLTETIPAIAKESVPFSVQNAIETRDPLSAGLSALGAQSSLVTPAEKRDFARDKVAKEKFGQGYADLLGEQKAAVNRDERVAGHQKEVEKRGLEREDKFVQASTAYRAKIEAAGRYLTFGKDDVGKPYSGDDYREAYSDAAKEFAGAQSVLDERSGDKILDGWFALYDDAALADGSTDYKKLERLQVQYEAAHPEVVEKIAKLTGTRDDEVAAAYRKARKLANEFYDIPAYRGLSVEESEAASGAMAMASGLVSNGAARSRNHAYILLMEQGLLDEDAVLSAKLAVRAGSNPERKAFRAANPAFGRFYSATPLFDQFETGYVGGSTERPSGGTIRRGSRILEGRTRNRLRG